MEPLGPRSRELRNLKTLDELSGSPFIELDGFCWGSSLVVDDLVRAMDENGV